MRLRSCSRKRAAGLLLAVILTACTGPQTTPLRQAAGANTASPTAVSTTETAVSTTETADATTETADAPALTPTAEPSPQPTPTRAAPQVRGTLLLAHTMPWYQSEEISGAWGWHWTMNHFNPAQGELASHYTPLTGPYDSSDPALLEYQVLLMKLAGIDGVIVDWYGTADFWDYAANQRGAQILFTYAQKAGLKFAVCYEDQTLKHMLDNQHLQAGEDLVQAQADMRFMQQAWFHDAIYLKQKDRPVLLVFGPQHFKDAAEWRQVFAGLDPAPLLVSEDTILWDAALSSYPWPPMWASIGGVLSQKALDDYLTAFYLRAAEQPYRVAGAFPGFDDIYQEAGVSTGYGVLDARGGGTFRDTLERAVASSPDVIQLITWNDYGEGTNIEPAQEYGYLYLEILQEFRRQNIQPGFSPQPADLRLPLELYHLRKQHAGDAAANAALDQVFAAIVSGDIQSAATLLEGIK